MSGESKFDIQMIVALGILEKIHHYNEKQNDEMRQFNVRIGINENVDNVIEDINGRRNVAGSGINLASRIMDNADGGQILVSQAVYDILHVREKYTDAFKSYSATIKHGIEIPVHQYIKDGHIGLDTKTPSSLSSEKTVYRLSKKSAYYFAHAIKNREFIAQKLAIDGSVEYTSVILLWYLADDSCTMSEVKSFESPNLKLPGDGKLTFEQLFEIFDSIHFDVRCDFSNFIAGSHLEKYHEESFEVAKYGFKRYCIINKHGQEKLKKQHPDI